jgi:hypothetical protein
MMINKSLNLVLLLHFDALNKVLVPENYSDFYNQLLIAAYCALNQVVEKSRTGNVLPENLVFYSQKPLLEAYNLSHPYSF